MLKKYIRLSLMDIYYVPILYLILFPTHILHVHLIKNNQNLRNGAFSAAFHVGVTLRSSMVYITRTLFI
jgi:hypothetical protein